MRRFRLPVALVFFLIMGFAVSAEDGLGAEDSLWDRVVAVVLELLGEESRQFPGLRDGYPEGPCCVSSPTPTTYPGLRDGYPDSPTEGSNSQPSQQSYPGLRDGYPEG